MARIAVCHQKPEEAKALLAKLGDGAKLMTFREIRKFEPDIVVISLAFVPSHGRAIGLMLRIQKWSRAIPLIFVDGEPEKVERIHGELPDATYTTMAKVGAAIKSALKKKPGDPVVPQMDRQWKRTLPDKIGLKPEMVVVLAGDVPDIARLVGEVYEQIRWTERASRTTKLVMWFVRSQQEVADGLRDLTGPWPIWIFWPKRTSRIKSDVTPFALRDLCNAYDLVDFKILSLDNTWSGMLFSRRRQ